jgi:hypothetical protein
MILITSGCSFSETVSTHIDTWPRHLARKLNVTEHISRGLGSQGNGLISRKVLYSIYESMKLHSIDEIIVGIMWSGPGRGDYLIEDLSSIDTPNSIKKFSVGTEIPTNVVTEKRWAILNPHWFHPLADDYYRVNSHEFMLYQTLEHMLRIQWFLKLHGIKYFMAPYTSDVLKHDINDENKHLRDMIDFDQWLPIEGCYEWCRDNTDIKFAPNDNHPSSEQHEIFTDKVIIPFLKGKGYV